MNIGYRLIAGRQPPNFKDLTNKVFGALHCISKSHSDQSLVYWNAVCLVCGFKKVIRTFILKKGYCTNCKSTKAPEPLQQVS
jgi:predicted Zn-ribbon and HTH transcriptional regulator